jgi:hypothetical protein
MGLTPSWFAWSPAVSGSFVFNTRTLDTVADDPLRDDTCSNSAFLSAMEPLVQDYLHLGVRGKDTDLSISESGFDVRGGYVVSITLPIAIPIWVTAVKRVPLAVVFMDIPAARFGTRLAGVGRVDRFGIDTADARMHHYATIVLGSHPGGTDPGEFL